MRAAIIAGVVALLVSATSATAAFVVTSKNIKNGTIQTVDLSAKAKQALKGTRGPRGLQGAMGLPGQTGPKGDRGPTGDPWTLNGSLPSGKTLRGVYAVYAVAPSFVTPASFEEAAISFGFVLSAKPVAHYVFAGDPATAECPGTEVSPQATAGHLCVYESMAADNTGATGVFNPVDNAANESSARGFGIHVEPVAEGPYWVQGSWAVTAP